MNLVTCCRDRGVWHFRVPLMVVLLVLGCTAAHATTCNFVLYPECLLASYRTYVSQTQTYNGWDPVPQDKVAKTGPCGGEDSAAACSAQTTRKYYMHGDLNFDEVGLSVGWETTMTGTCSYGQHDISGACKRWGQRCGFKRTTTDYTYLCNTILAPDCYVTGGNDTWLEWCETFNPSWASGCPCPG